MLFKLGKIFTVTGLSFLKSNLCLAQQYGSSNGELSTCLPSRHRNTESPSGRSPTQGCTGLPIRRQETLSQRAHSQCTENRDRAVPSPALGISLSSYRSTGILESTKERIWGANHILNRSRVTVIRVRANITANKAADFI